MTTHTDQQWQWETAGPVTLPRLAAWERLDEAGAALVLAHPQVPEGTFRPNLVVRLGSTGGLSLAALSTRAVIATLQSFPQAHIVGHEEATVADVPARRQTFTYLQAGQAVCVLRWFCVLGDLSVEIIGSFAPDQSVGMETLLHRMVELARVDNMSVATRPGQRASAEPALDPVASEHLGRPLEDLSRIAAVQPFVSGGPVISNEALDLLMECADGKGVGMADRFRRRAQIEELSAAGLMDASGKLAAAGLSLVAPLRGPTFSFAVGAQRADLATSVTAWVGADGAFLVSGPAPAAARGAGTPALGQVQVALVSAAHLPSVLVAWLGVGPAWSYIGENVAVTREAFARRLETGALTSAPGRDPALVRLWEQPWLAWSLQESGAAAPQNTWLSAGTAGQHLAFVNQGGSMELEPFASSAVWSVMARFVHDGLVRAGVR
ncbi:hypothetical protein [Arthrobacter cheniae]|uniref:hypothetical protein n=1 Tax=Arthrobacter cheniae TaxID=1258888 RepID=UPI00160465A3|nr:hypothetical protein [Arthrobacter cheniae]